MSQIFRSSLFFKETIDFGFADKETDLLIIDKTLLSLFPHVFTDWSFLYGVSAGESLKEWKTAAQHIETLAGFWGCQAHRQSRVIVCGGGSVGDFGGFYASVLKRGVELVHVPTTWLAAIDSAHGGKNGLNVQGVKNQIGAFYPARGVHIFKEFLLGQSLERAIDGFGEYLKMRLIENATLDMSPLLKKQNLMEILWQDLKTTIESKYLIVEEDPRETLGVRLLLNLGHTFGHILEALTQSSHGLCVLQGLDFSMKWSVARGFMSVEDQQHILKHWRQLSLPLWSDTIAEHRFSKSSLQTLFKQDKKIISTGELNFVFMKSGGRAFVQKVSLDEFTQEVQRQGWVES